MMANECASRLLKVASALLLHNALQLISTQVGSADGLLVPSHRSPNISAKYRCTRSATALSLFAPRNDANGDDKPTKNDYYYANVECPLRRQSIVALITSASFLFSNAAESVPITTTDDTSNANIGEYAQLTIPLNYVPKLSAYTISYTVGKTKFGAIVDTGSPFLVVPSTSCKPDYPWGCYRPEESRETNLSPTLERFDGNEGLVEWREGRFSFALDDLNDEIIAQKDGDGVNSVASSPISKTTLATASALSLLFPQSSSMTFGVISESLMDGPGGIFLGLVKNTDDWIRPSFLKQSDVTAFAVDLRNAEGLQKTLTLYGGVKNEATDPSVNNETNNPLPAFRGKQGNQRFVSGTPKFNSLLDYRDAIPLVRDLNKKYGDPTIHYVGVASSINVNGVNLASTSRRRGKLYVIFDTGCSGMSICPDLFDERYDMARSRREKSLWGEVEVELDTNSGEKIQLKANRPITTPLGSEQPWGRKLNGHLIVLGLAFLEGKKMTVDIDGDNIWFE